ncbi:sugar ABC transporter ATP-binding protein [Mesorhizobium sp. BH1-1-5]|uniref:sugar ABC transporter ATP-binding protein n=1 Tax=Mesorhizobium sp. BH1-1-5 TaxID=2876661 RepID=UPI001CC996A3|nr:sugar ABC transporter ATP-binding protein [Mesorhizobium sp. BH1-1-5]MBZ9990650.1 sugar ABC transporter ATP-binding protein [Mesorhizobium sp. BH1-1-5]
MSDSPVISVRNLAKRLGGFVALEDMSLAAERGTIHAVVGESGAGKSVLARILAGIERADGGAIEIDGHKVAIDSPNTARKHGLAVVLQQSALFPDRPVLANLFVNREPLQSGLVSRREMRARSFALLRQLGLAVDVGAPLGELDPGERQLVGIAAALLEHPRLLVLDEPCEALDRNQRDRLFAVLRELKARGMTILHLTNRLEEALALADQVTVMRNGRDVLSKPRSDLTATEEAMIGQLGLTLFPLPLRSLSNLAGTLRPQLTVSGLSGGRLAGVEFSARGGEITGLAGLPGSGASDVLAMLFGHRRARKGKVRFPDGDSLPRTRTEAARRGICLTSSHAGVMADRSIAFNLSSVVVGARDWGRRWYSPKAAAERAARQVEALRIRSGSDELAGSLSTGGRQKVAIGRWLEIGPQVVLLDEPARGIDTGSKQEIYGLIRQMAASGCIMLLHSTEMSELAGLCDRVLAFRDGRIAGEVAGAEMDAAALRKLITGDTAAPAPEPATTSQRNAA